MPVQPCASGNGRDHPVEHRANLLTARGRSRSSRGSGCRSLSGPRGSSKTVAVALATPGDSSGPGFRISPRSIANRTGVRDPLWPFWQRGGPRNLAPALACRSCEGIGSEWSWAAPSNRSRLVQGDLPKLGPGFGNTPTTVRDLIDRGGKFSYAFVSYWGRGASPSVLAWLPRKARSGSQSSPLVCGWRWTDRKGFPARLVAGLLRVKFRMVVPWMTRIIDDRAESPPLRRPDSVGLGDQDNG